MERITGKTVHKGIALGPVHVLRGGDYSVKKEKIEDSLGEIKRFHDAKNRALEELQVLYEKALKELGKNNAAIFQIHRMLLEDKEYLDVVEKNIHIEQVNAEYAVKKTGEYFANMFAGMNDEYMQARGVDILDITGRLIKILCGSSERKIVFSEPVIIVAKDLTPSETVGLDKNKVLGFVTVHGSSQSHTAILARTMNIPALIGVNVNIGGLEEGTEALINGYTQEFVINPTGELRKEAEKELQAQRERQVLLQKLKGQQDITLSGKKVNVYANIGSIADLDYALENDAGGVGLFRTEFLYMGRESLPSEEEQFAIYKQAVEKLKGKKLVVRTLDMGADKQADYLKLEKEDNPALGFRAIRICLTRKDIFKTQLRALYRAAVYGNLSVMYPMIISVEEVLTIKEITKEVKAELGAEKIPFGDVEEGIMIETPAAALISDELAELVDFFSIGTNDLAQYTLAIDRQNAKLDTFYNPHHKAVMKMIKMVIDNAHRAQKWVGICGELGADTELIPQFVEMGIDELSVVPAFILKLRGIIRQLP